MLSLVLLCGGVTSHDWFGDYKSDGYGDTAVALRAEGMVPARRHCRPGPQLTRPEADAGGWVLVIGDSISLGAMRDLQTALGTSATVSHAPWSSDGGALDSKYAMDTDIEMTGAGAGPAWVGNGSLAQFRRFGDGCLNGTFLKDTSYDVISFNYGVHDVDYSAYHEEWVPLDVYKQNIRAIKLTLLGTGAKVVFQASTPVSYNTTTNTRILAYNAAAKEVMEEAPTAAYNDLYGAITAVCGQPPYNSKADPSSPNCSIADYNGVHYHAAGWQTLANSTASSIRALLPKHGAPVAAAASESEIKSEPGPVQCQAPSSKPPTSCPSNSTCMKSSFSSTGMGCCIGYGASAVDCGDGTHCCPAGWKCSEQCHLGGCFCRPP